jgi:hypothetical protein
MSVNRERPHVLVLPEDDANRQLANGFHLEVDAVRQRQMQVLRVAGGWNEVLRLFESEHVAEMDRCNHRSVVLLIDFDNAGDRLSVARSRVPDRLSDRVFILGAASEPEDLARARPDGLTSYESIGRKMAEECRDSSDGIWEHNLLRHNSQELERLRQRVRAILF